MTKRAGLLSALLWIGLAYSQAKDLAPDANSTDSELTSSEGHTLLDVFLSSSGGGSAQVAVVSKKSDFTQLIRHTNMLHCILHKVGRLIFVQIRSQLVQIYYQNFYSSTPFQGMP